MARQADPLIGKYFSTYRTSQGGGRDMVWSGQVCRRVKDGLHLVKIMNAASLVFDGLIEYDTQRIVSVDDMKDWEFFDSFKEWAKHHSAYDREMERRSNTHYTASGSSPGAR